MFSERDRILQQIVDQHGQSGVKKSLLIVDESREEYSLKFFEKSADYVVLDAKTLHKKKFVRRTPMNVLLDENRHLIAYEMLREKVLVIRLAELAVDFLNTFCDEACPEVPKRNPQPPYQPWRFLPRGFLLDNGEMIKQDPHSLLRRDDLREVKEYMQKRRMARLTLEREGEDEADERSGAPLSSIEDIADLTLEEACSPSFRVIVTTTTKPENLQEILFNGKFGLPTTSMSDFIIHSFNPSL